MPFRLVHSTPDASDFADHPISRLQYAPSRRGASQAQPDHDVSAFSSSETDDFEHSASEGSIPDEFHPDPAKSFVQADAEDVALIKLAAAKAAAALTEVSVLMGRKAPSWKRDALARCVAKGWITLHGVAFSDKESFRVTPQGYPAAGLRLPLFMP